MVGYRRSVAQMKPRFGVLKRPMLGRTVGEVGGADAEPGGEGGGVFVDAGRGNPAPETGVVGAVDGEGGHLAVEVAAFDGAAHDDGVAAPTVVGAVAVGAEGAAEIGGGEGGDLVGDAELDGGFGRRRPSPD